MDSRSQWYPPALAVLTCFFLLQLYNSYTSHLNTLSPQGCRMSYMYPSYLAQPDFDTTWTRLANRYSLWLYREVDLDPEGKVRRFPLLNPSVSYI